MTSHALPILCRSIGNLHEFRRLRQRLFPVAADALADSAETVRQDVTVLEPAHPRLHVAGVQGDDLLPAGLDPAPVVHLPVHVGKLEKEIDLVQ